MYTLFDISKLKFAKREPKVGLVVSASAEFTRQQTQSLLSCGINPAAAGLTRERSDLRSGEKQGWQTLKLASFCEKII